MSGALPKGWCLRPLRDLLAEPLANGRSVPTADEGFPVLRLTSLRDGTIDLAERKIGAWTEADAQSFRVSAGDVLVSRGSGSLHLVGRAGLVGDVHEPVAFPDTLIRVRPRVSDCDSRFLVAQWNAPHMREQIERVAKTTAGIYKVSQGDLVVLTLAIPPVREQRRIVAKLDGLRARSRRAREALDAVAPLLEKLRQSILAAAFRGDLTKDWRAKNRDVEPASKLLERIRAERRKKWEESEVAKMKGRLPTDDKWKAKYKEPAPVDTTGLPELPEGWCWASVEELSARVTDGTHQSPAFTAAGIPFLVIANVINGRIDWPSVSKWVSRETYEANTARCRPERGDVLYTAVGSYGVALSIEVDDEFMFQRHIAHIKPLSAVVQPAFLALILNAPQTKARADGVARGVAQKTVTLGELARFPVPIPPLAEQEEARKAVAELLGRVEAMEARLDTFVTDLEALNRSTLAKAFRGELVAQDPNDEPAGEMLDLAPAELDAVGRVSETKSRLARRRKAG